MEFPTEGGEGSLAFNPQSICYLPLGEVDSMAFLFLIIKFLCYSFWVTNFLPWSEAFKVLVQVDTHLFYFNLYHNTPKSFFVGYLVREYILGKVDYTNRHIEGLGLRHSDLVSYYFISGGLKSQDSKVSSKLASPNLFNIILSNEGRNFTDDRAVTTPLSHIFSYQLNLIFIC